jgi:hypothetical protein
MPYKQTTFYNYRKAARASNAYKTRQRAAARASFERAKSAYLQSKRIKAAMYKNRRTASGRAANKYLKKHKNYDAPYAPTLWK